MHFLLQSISYEILRINEPFGTVFEAGLSLSIKRRRKSEIKARWMIGGKILNNKAAYSVYVW
jgi:hypothetical protein